MNSQWDEVVRIALLALQKILGISQEFHEDRHQDRQLLLPLDSYQQHSVQILVEVYDSQPVCVELSDLSQDMAEIVDTELSPWHRH